LVSEDGAIRLGDFGISTELSQNDSVCNIRAGSPHWMAPEVLDTNPEYDFRADIWSLGITAIELACGFPPSYHLTGEQILHENARLANAKRPPPLLPKASTWSENFHDFVYCCLIKNFKSRYSAEYLLMVCVFPN
jgi:serine/threonine-protein kinase 24/25/MST4